MSNNYICVSFEGLDTCGKTSMVKILDSYFSQLGYKVKSFKDFTDNAKTKESFVTEIRNFLLHESNYDELPKTATPFLITAIRLKMIHDIRNFIENECSDRPVIILLDRYIHSTLAYDFDSTLDIEQLKGLCKYACELLKPDLSIFLDIHKDVYLERIKNRGKKDKIESSLDTRFDSIRERFLNIFYEVDLDLSCKYITLDNNKFDNEQKCKDLIMGLLVSKDYNRDFDVKI